MTRTGLFRFFRSLPRSIRYRIPFPALAAIPDAALGGPRQIINPITSLALSMVPARIFIFGIWSQLNYVHLSIP
jgi:hypothetical protein